ncbi:MAG: DUF951 domain-containing protein [Anaerotruncus sp.]|nr:DUF951 domain-containing protein [Anaerotruncus sp.]
MENDLKLGSVVVLKKGRPCEGQFKWEIVRFGVDRKIKCFGLRAHRPHRPHGIAAKPSRKCWRNRHMKELPA